MKKYLLMGLWCVLASAAFAQGKEIMNNASGYGYEYYYKGVIENKSYQDITGWMGAVRVSGGRSLYFKNVDFLRNNIGVSIIGGGVGFADVNFDNNFSGGGLQILTSGYDSTLLGLERVRFTNNRGTSGAGVYSVLTDSRRVGLFNTVDFDYNTATQNGGGMFIKHGYQTMKNVRFTGNSANLGGAIYAENDFTLIGSNVHFTGNTATQGGGIYAAKNLTLHAENGDIVFTGNTGHGVYMGGANSVLRLEGTPTGSVIFNDTIGGAGKIVAAGSGVVRFNVQWGSAPLYLSFGAVSLDHTKDWSSTQLVCHGGGLHLADSQAVRLNLGSLDLQRPLTLVPEVDMSGGKMDSLRFQSVSGYEGIRLEGFRLLSANAEAPTTLPFMEGAGKERVSVGADAYDDVFRYQATYNSSTGEITFTPQKLLLSQGLTTVKAFAPQVLLQPLTAYVAAQALFQESDLLGARRMAQVFAFDSPKSALYLQPFAQDNKQTFTNQAQVKNTRQGAVAGGMSADWEWFDDWVSSGGWYVSYQQDSAKFEPFTVRQSQYVAGGDLFLYSYRFFVQLMARAGIQKQTGPADDSRLVGGGSALMGWNIDLAASEWFLQPYGRYGYSYVAAGKDLQSGSARLPGSDFSLAQAEGGMSLWKLSDGPWRWHVGGAYLKQMPVKSQFTAGSAALPDFELDPFVQATAGVDWAGEKVALGADMQARFGKVRGWGGSLYVMF